MRRLLVLAAMVMALMFPVSVLAGSGDASPCGAYHGVFQAPAIDVGGNASNGNYKFGVVGELNSDPACRE
jgi:hypothetical protein